jgi:3-hydroxyisobutyrate dehydrogenase
VEGAGEMDVPMLVSGLVHEIVQSLIGHGWTDTDFAILLEHQARASGLALEPENIAVSDGLEESDGP